jgi:CRISPR/Cas system-associated exonuclease Cas4 (RecB family)
MDIEHISVSRKGCWDECKQKYKYRYHLKTQVDTPTPVYFTYGKIVHRVAEIYVGEGGKRPINEVADDLLAGKVLLERDEVSPPLPKEYRKKFPKHLQNIADLTQKIGFDGELEYKFRYDLDPPNNKIITGFIDRLIIRGDKFFILDYKTTKKGGWRKNKYTIRGDLQLRAYARVIQKLFGAKAENIKAALHYVDGGDVIATAFNDKMLMEAENILLAAYNQITESDPDKVYGRTGDHCRRCDYVKICPFFNMALGKDA